MVGRLKTVMWSVLSDLGNQARMAGYMIKGQAKEIGRDAGPRMTKASILVSDKSIASVEMGETISCERMNQHYNGGWIFGPEIELQNVCNAIRVDSTDCEGDKTSLHFVKVNSEWERVEQFPGV